MNPAYSNNIERLFLRSLDGELGEEERRNLSVLLEQDYKFQTESRQFIKIREMLLRRETDSLGPFFAERVIHQIKIMKKEIDYLILFFFKKYQLVAVGILVALLVLNIFLSDQLSIKSILGIEEETVDEIITLDLYKDITE